MKLAKDDPKIEYYDAGGKPFHRCGVCRMYVDPNRCSLVAGLIRPYGHCKRFEPIEK